MSYPTSAPQMPAYGQWPVTSDPGDRALRMDLAAAVLLILGGAAGIAQLWVPWRGGLSGSPGTGGWDVFQGLKAALRVQGGFAPTVGAYAVLAVVVLGVASLLLGVLMLLPVDHRPPAVVAVVAAILTVLCGIWWVFWHAGAGGLGTMFSDAGIGWYLFLCSGFVALAGAIKGLASST